MNELQRAKLIQEEHDAMMKTHGGDRRSGGFSSVQNELLKSEPIGGVGHNKTRFQIAAEHNMAPAAVQRAVFVGRGIDKAAEVDPE